MKNFDIGRLSDRRLRAPAIAMIATYLLYVALTVLMGRAVISPWAAAVIPALPLVVIAALFVVVYHRLDEVEKAMHHAALGAGFIAAMLCAVLVGRFEAHGLVAGGAELVWTVGALGWMVGLVLGRLRYR